MVSEIAIMRTLLLKKKKALFILPCKNPYAFNLEDVSIVSEKVACLQEFGRALNFNVEVQFIFLIIPKGVLWWPWKFSLSSKNRCCSLYHRERSCVGECINRRRQTERNRIVSNR